MSPSLLQTAAHGSPSGTASVAVRISTGGDAAESTVKNETTFAVRFVATSRSPAGLIAIAEPLVGSVRGIAGGPASTGPASTGGPESSSGPASTGGPVSGPGPESPAPASSSPPPSSSPQPKVNTTAAADIA